MTGMYYCPPDRPRTPGQGPWCAQLPCAGHRATRDQVLVARVLAGQHGLRWERLDAEQRRSWLTSARGMLHELGPALGVPR